MIPAFNAARYVRDAIQSVLDQTYDRVECLVIDDGSTDETRAIVRSFDHVRYVYQENGGVSKARNKGIQEADSDLVAFLDADDTWSSEKLRRQVALISSRPELGLVYCALTIADEVLQPTGIMHAPQGVDALRNSLLMESPVVSIALTGVVPKRIVEGIGGFDERMTTSADTDLFCRIALEHPVDGLDEPLALYRQHAGQMHHDVDAMEHDMTLLFEKLFTGAHPQLNALERRARANLETTIGLAKLRKHRFGEAAGHLARSVRWDPGSLLRTASKRFRKA